MREGVRWALTNPLAYDIAATVGAITSPSRPVRFFLNGEFQGVFVLYEHFHPNHYFRAHGQRAIRLERRRVRGACGTQIRALTPVTMATAGEIVDIENLTRWFIAIAFCATRDPFQGPSQFRDASRRARTVVLGQLGHGCQLRRRPEQSVSRAAAAPGRRASRPEGRRDTPVPHDRAARAGSRLSRVLQGGLDRGDELPRSRRRFFASASSTTARLRAPTVSRRSSTCRSSRRSWRSAPASSAGTPSSTCRRRPCRAAWRPRGRCWWTGTR